MSLEKLNKITFPIQTLLTSFGPSEHKEKIQVSATVEGSAQSSQMPHITPTFFQKKKKK